MSVNKQNNATTTLTILILGKITCSVHEKQSRSSPKKKNTIGYKILPPSIYITYVRVIKLEQTPCILTRWWVII